MLLVEGERAHVDTRRRRVGLHDRVRAQLLQQLRSRLQSRGPEDVSAAASRRPPPLRRIPRRENRRTPYAQLGSIAKDDTELPMCCVNVPLKAVKTDRMQFLPGRQGKMPECPPCVGCLLIEGGAVYEPWVDHMVQVLNSKKVSRGNVGQMQKAEQQEARVEELHKKMDAIMAHLKITYQGMPPLAELRER